MRLDQQWNSWFCHRTARVIIALIEGTIPPGVPVLLDSHPDDEIFFLLSGTFQALVQREDSFEEVTMFSVSPRSLLDTTIGSPVRRKTPQSESTYWNNAVRNLYCT